MTHLLPTGADLNHWAWFLWLVAVTFVALVAVWIGMDAIQDNFDAMRAADTPEPERRQQLNTVIQFPTRRMQ